MKTRLFSAIFTTFVLTLSIQVCILRLSAQQQVPPPPGNLTATAPPDKPAQQKVFVFVQRSDRHAKYSKPEVFHDALSDVLGYLAAKNVAIAVDEFGGRNHAEGATPLDTVFSIARDAQANGLLCVLVDRPATKWIKMSVQCYDMNGKPLWQEEASSGGGLSGGHGFEVTTNKLHAQLANTSTRNACRSLPRHRLLLCNSTGGDTR